MTHIRFGRLFVVFCMGLAAACTSGTDGGSSGQSEINLWIGNDIDDDGVGDPGATSGELGFDVDRVDYRVSCAGNAPGSYPIPPSNTNGDDYNYDDSVDITGQFEVVDGRDPPVWQALEDLPPGLCTISLWVFDGDDLVCSGTQTLGIIEDGVPPTKYDIVLVCSLSIDTPDGRADVDGTFDFITGNLCPKIYTLNAIHTEVDAATGSTEIQYRAKDPDNQCGANCDPCTPDFSTNPPTCPPDTPDPGMTCTLVAPGGSFSLLQDAPGGVPPAGFPIGPVVPVNLNTFGEALGGPGFILPGLDIAYQCDTSTPGTTTITVFCTDGDLECDKSLSYDIVCPGANLCDGSGACTVNADCGTAGTCTGGFCDAVTCTAPTCQVPGTCSAGDGLCSAPTNEANGTDCTTGAGGPGECNAGVCEASGCTIDADCDTGDACTNSTCNVGTGICAPATPDNDGGACINSVGGPGTCNAGVCESTGCVDDSACTPADPCLASTCTTSTGLCTTPGPGNDGAMCINSVGGPGTCAAGACVATGCTVDADCDTGDACTTSTCAPGTGVCSGEVPDNEGGACTAGGGQAGICTSGSCAIVFDLTGEFRAYNNLLPAEGAPAACGGAIPAGPPVDTCTAPDLCLVDGSTICAGAGINDKCITVAPGGSLLFSDDGAGNVAFTGNVDQTFIINANIDLLGTCGIVVQVNITTSSTTAVLGSGPGSVSVGGSVDMDPVTAPDPPDVTPTVPFNVIYSGTGTVLCEVVGADPASICPLAGLGPGVNPVPQAGDPQARVWPDIEFLDQGAGKLDLQFLGGPTQVSGWSLSNPPDLASAGTQFITLEGAQP